MVEEKVHGCRGPDPVGSRDSLRMMALAIRIAKAERFFLDAQ